MKDIRVKNLEENWKSDERWKGIERPYSAEKVIGLRGPLILNIRLLEEEPKSSGTY